MDYIGNIGVRVRHERYLKGWSQEELAKRSGLSPGHISEIENGERKNLQARTLKKLAQGLEVDVAVLLGECPDEDEGVTSCV